MDRADDVGPRQHEHVAVALEVARMVREAVAAEVGLRQLVALDHRPHRAVEDQDAFGEQALAAWMRRCGIRRVAIRRRSAI